MTGRFQRLSLILITLFFLPACPSESWHSAAVGRISKSSNGKRVLSCSFDNTLKLWDLSSGNLIKKFSIPESQNGQLFSCALSPDGQRAAAAGWSSSSSGVSYSLYLFNTASGKLIKSITIAESPVLDLKFSADGKTLAAALKRGGVRIFDGRTGSPLSSLQPHSSPVYSIAFSKDGLLVSADSQGVVRLYSNDLRLLKSRHIGKHRVLSSVSVCADGTLAAVGFERPGGVAVLALPSLVTVRELQFVDANRCGTVLVDWMPQDKGVTGTFGRVYGQVQTVLFKWELFNGGRFKETVLDRSGILDIKVLTDGSIVFAGLEGDWGRFDSLGRVIYQIKKLSKHSLKKFSIEVTAPISNSTVSDSVIPVTLQLKETDKLLDFELYVNGVRKPAVFTDVIFEYQESRRRILVPLVNGRNRIVLWCRTVSGQRASVAVIVYRKNKAEDKR
ncbi:MAG: hypothetical protein LBI42_13680 [Chitinispirillales bacterium]|jgi:hypothetical protein|nr:hypothetical protein [Chitinispirillales bacterium]